MQTPSFKDKIQKQHEVVLKQLNKFHHSWQGRIIPIDKIQTYCNLISYLSDLHSTYLNNCMEYFTPSMKQQTLQINKNLINDLIKKLKHFQSPFPNNGSFLKSTPKQAKQTCHVCSSKIREVDVKIIKEQLADDAFLRMSLLKKMHTDLQNQNASLFTKDEDQVFFQFLNRILVKKEEVLAMQTQQISDFLIGITKSFSDLNFLTEYTPVKLGSTEYKQNYREEMEKTIVDTLKSGFNGKVHPWVHKVFESMKQHILREKRMNYSDQSQQTEVLIDINKKRSEYAANSQSRKELDLLKQQVQKHILLIDQLKAQITVLTKQKKQLEEYYTKEVNELRIEKRSIELELKKTQTDFLNLKTLKDTQIFELNKKLAKQRKKTQPNYPTSKNYDQSQENNPNQNPDKQHPLNESNLQNQPEQALKQKQKNQNLFNKKKPNLKRIFSNKPEYSQTNLTNYFKNSSDLSLLNATTPLKNTFNSPDNHFELEGNPFINPNRTIPVDNTPLTNDHKESNNSVKIAEEFLKEIKLRNNKRKEKATERNSLKQQESSQEQTPKVDFKLDPLIQKNEKFQVIAEQSHETQTGLKALQVTGSTPKMSKRKLSQKKIKGYNGQKKNKRGNKRMLSIEINIPPLIKAGQSIYKPKNEQVNFSEASQVLNASNSASKAVISSKKKVFEYVPIQNEQEYKLLKEKVNEITSRIELRNNEKFKQSVRYIKQEGSSSDLTSMYGFSVFGKKFSQVVKEDQGNYSRSNDKSKSRAMDRSKDSKGSGQSQQNGDLDKGIVIESQPIKAKANSKRYRTMSKKNKPQVVDYSQQTESITRANYQNSPIDHISIEQRKSLFNTLADQSVIPHSLTFHHYEMIIRKLFAQQKSQLINQANLRLIKSRASTLNNHEEKKDKQKQSVKINIDAKFFQNIDPNKTHHQTLRPAHHTSLNQGKLLLNLPKINHSPSILVSSLNNNNNQQNNTIFNGNLAQGLRNNKSLFHTVRQSKTQFKNQSLTYGRNKQWKYDISNQSRLEKKTLTEQSDPNLMGQSEHIKQNVLSPLTWKQKTNPQESNTSQSPCFSKGKTSRIEHSPSSILQPLNPRHTHVFSPNDIKLLFQSQLTAYEYEQLIKTQPPSSKTYQLTQQDNDSLKSLHQVLNQIKQKNSQIYYKVCSFVKSPYQSVRGGFDFINTAKDLSLEAWTQYLTKIYTMRKGETPRNTHNKENYQYNYKANAQKDTISFTGFLKPFEEKLVELLILAQK